MTTPWQRPLDLEVDYGWFHIMKPRLLAGLIAEVGEPAWAVYCVIKAHSENATGRAWPSHETIGKLIGRHADTVSRAVKTLVEHRLVETSKSGRHTVYRMLEAAPLRERATGEAAGTADFKYVPKEFAEQIKALRDLVQIGVSPGKSITLNLHVNIIQQRDGGTVNISKVDIPGNIENRADVQEMMRKLRLLNN